MSFIELKQVGKFYESHRVLTNVNLDLNLNEFVSIIGQSGCGKTTLLNVIGLIEDNEEGSIKINNRVVHKKKKSYYRYNFFSYVYQNYELVDYLTAKENILLNIYEQKDDFLMSLAEHFKCADLLDKYPDELSGGEKQRISIIRALIKNPRVIICDEPAGQLDSKNAELVMSYLKENNEGKLIIVATHNIELAKKYSTRIIHLSEGLVADDNKLDEVKVIEEAEETHNYRFNKSKLVNSSYRFTKTTRQMPLFICTLFSIILTILSCIVGLKTGVNEYVNTIKYERLDSDYFELSYYKDNTLISAHDSIIRIVNDLGLNYAEFYNYSYLFNNFFYESIKAENDLNFDFEISVIDLSSYNADIICNSLFREKSIIENLTLYTPSQVLDLIVSPNLDLKISKICEESTIYNTPKIYLSYEYVNNLFDKTFKDYIFIQDEIVIPQLLFMKDDLNVVYKIIRDAKYMTSYIEAAATKQNSFVVYKSSSVIMFESFSDLVDSLSLSLTIITVILLILIFTILMLITRNLFIKRRKEIAILYSYGVSKNDLKWTILIQNSILLFPSLIVSIVFYYLIHSAAFNLSNKLIGKTFNILEFDIKGIIASVYIIVLISIVSSIQTMTNKNINLLKEELHDE